MSKWDKEIKTRKYPFHKYMYSTVLEVIDGYQVIRIFDSAGIELQRLFVTENGRLEKIIALGCNCFNYNYRPNYNTLFKVRNAMHICYYPDKLYIKSVLPNLKLYLKAYQTNGMSIFHYIQYCLQLDNNNSAETLVKINKNLFSNLYLSSHTQGEFVDLLDKYKRQWQLLTKWKYKISVKELRIYIDYLELLTFFRKDLHSPKYLMPKDIKKAHDHYVKLKEQLKYTFSKEQAKEYFERNSFLIPFEASSSNIVIKPLTTLKQVKDEALEQHNCLFTNEYWKKADNLLFTSFVNGKKAETIQFSIQKNKVVQATAFKNFLHELHNDIVCLANKEIKKFLGNIQNELRREQAN